MMRMVFAGTLSLLFAGCALSGAAAGRSGNVEHLVLLKFKEGTPAAKVEEVMAEFRKLPSKIPGIERFEEGPNMSAEKLDKGFTQGVIVTFRNAAARDGYITHPQHEAFKALALPLIAEVCVVDFLVKP